MNCLCCGKPLKTDEPSGWHKACVKRFFGTSVIPELEIDNGALEHLAIETAGKGLTIRECRKSSRCTSCPRAESRGSRW
ncbi:MAG: hypothetical protein ACLSG5_07335 [Oscillospiraceae bacterium]